MRSSSPEVELIEQTSPPIGRAEFPPQEEPPTSVQQQTPYAVADSNLPPAKRTRQRSRQARVTTGSKLLFLDVETTGLSVDDRIVSLGMARMNAADLLKVDPSGLHNFNADIVHLVFNPQRPNHPAAQRVHGWSDDVLARQPLFAAHASTVLEMLEGSDVWLAHNVSFDLRFVESELTRLDRSPERRPTFCTMEKAKSEWRGETSRLDHCIGRIGLKRSGERHGALEDAVLCAALFTYFRTGRTLASLPDCPGPSNLIQ